MAFKFDIDLTENMAAKLRPLASELKATREGLVSVRVESGYLDEAMKKIASVTRITHTTLADQAKIAQGFVDFARAANEASHSMEGHNRIAHAMVNLFHEMGESTRRAVPASKRLTLEWGNMFHSFAGFRREATGWTFNVSEGLAALGSGLRTAWRIAQDLARTLVGVYQNMARAAGGAQDLRLGLRFAGGSDETARMADQLAGSFAGTTRLSHERVARGFLPLLRSGVRGQQLLDDLGTAAADVEALTSGETSFDEVMGAFRKIAVKRKVEDDQLAALGLNQADFERTLASRLGRSVEATKRMIAGGRVTAEMLLTTARDAMVRTQGRELGEAALASGNTLGASLQRLADLPETLYRQTADSPAMMRLRDTIDKFVTMMTGEAGVRIMDRLATALDKFLADVTPQRFVDVIETLGSALAASLPALKLIGDGLLALMGGRQEDIDRASQGVRVETGAVHRGQTITNFRGEDAVVGGGRLSIRLDQEDIKAALRRAGAVGSDFAERQAFQIIFQQRMHPDDPQFKMAERRALAILEQEMGSRIGAATVEGLTSGIRERTSLLEDAGAEAGMSLIEGAAGPSGIDARSPSKKFERLGTWAAEGLARGMERGTGRVRGARAALVGAALPDPSEGRRSAPGPSGDVFQFGDIIVTAGTGDAAEVGQAVRRELLAVVREARAAA